MFFAEIGEQELIQQGTKRFSVQNRATPTSWRQLGSPAELVATWQPRRVDHKSQHSLNN